MPKLIDLTNKRFGRLVVLRKSEIKKRGRPCWECLCDCGKLKFIASGNLLSGNSQSCGCLKLENRSLLYENLSGKKFTYLTVINFSHSHDKKRYWNCLCKCGTLIVVSTQQLTSENTKSCGCLSIERLRNRSISHGMSATKEYVAYFNMIQRCYNPNNISYKNYGGRGITVTNYWLESFENFYNDVGKAPSDKHELDRIDNNRDYSKCNCRWATRDVQTHNRRKCVKSSKYKGVRKTKYGWSSRITFKGKQVNIGTFRTENEAALAYNAKALELFKDKASINNLEINN